MSFVLNEDRLIDKNHKDLILEESRILREFLAPQLRIESGARRLAGVLHA